MNKAAEKHLSKAAGFLAKGEDFYRKAAEEILAAKEADHTLSNREIGELFDRSENWVRNIVRWITTSPVPAKLPYSDDTGQRQVRSAKQLLREAPMEQVEQIISELPKERRQQVAAAAGSGVAQAREEMAARERNLTPAERKEREAIASSIDTSVGKMMSGFDSLGIAGHLEQATEELREMVSTQSLSPETWRTVEEALDAFLTEAQVAAGMVGLELDRKGF